MAIFSVLNSEADHFELLYSRVTAAGFTDQHGYREDYRQHR